MGLKHSIPSKEGFSEIFSFPDKKYSTDNFLLLCKDSCLEHPRLGVANRKKDINSKTDQEYLGFTFGQRGEFFNSIDCYLYGSTCLIQCRCMDVFKSWQGEISAVAAAGGKIGGGNIDFFLKDVFDKNMFGSRGEQGVIQDASNAIQEGLDLTHLKTNLFNKKNKKFV